MFSAILKQKGEDRIRKEQITDYCICRENIDQLILEAKAGGRMTGKMQSYHR